MKYFVGLAVDESAPDHSTLTAFKARLRACGREEAFERMLLEIVKIAQEKGVEFGEIQVVDSVRAVANVNTAKDEERKNSGKPPGDSDAKWGVKGDRLVRTEEGEMKRVSESFYGYKAHVSLNAATSPAARALAVPEASSPTPEQAFCSLQGGIMPTYSPFLHTSDNPFDSPRGL